MSFWVAAGLCVLSAAAWLIVDPEEQLKATAKHDWESRGIAT
jgi:hypothetical protein